MKQDVIRTSTKEQAIEIDGIKIVMIELPLKTSRKIINNFIDYFTSGEEINFKQLVDEKWDLIVELSEDVITMPDGMHIDDLGYSSLKNDLYPAFKELNKDFLDDMIGELVSKMVVPDQTEKPSKDSTKPLQD